MNIQSFMSMQVNNSTNLYNSCGTCSKPVYKKINSIKLHCHHIFHKTCQPLMRKHSSCPSCEVDLRELKIKNLEINSKCYIFGAHIAQICAGVFFSYTGSHSLFLYASSATFIGLGVYHLYQWQMEENFKQYGSYHLPYTSYSS